MEHTKAKRTKKQRAENISFDLSVNGRNYAVNATPFTIASGDTMYRLSYNSGPVHVFGWDEGLNRYAETDELADVIPPVIEMEIAGKLNEFASEMQRAA
ncbi:MAG: hypothetical protein ABIR15_09280 [Chitinophagaceae bacterium]